MNKTTGKINVSELVTAAYQRECSDRVKKIVDEFDPILVNYLHVSIRDGKKWIIDGNHTAHALAIIYGNNYMADAFIYEGLTYEEEAHMFSMLNTIGKKPSYNEILVSKIEEGNEDAIAYKKLLVDSGIKYSFSSHAGRSKFIAHNSGVKCLKAYGYEASKRALETIKIIDDKDFYTGRLFAAIAFIYSKFQNIKDTDLRNAIEKAGYNKIYALANTYGRSTGGGCTACKGWVKAVADFYNKGRRNGKIEI